MQTHKHGIVLSQLGQVGVGYSAKRSVGGGRTLPAGQIEARRATFQVRMGGRSPQPGPANTVGGDYDPVASLEQNIIKLDVPEDPFATLPHYVDKWIPHNEVTLLAGHGGGASPTSP